MLITQFMRMMDKWHNKNTMCYIALLHVEIRFSIKTNIDVTYISTA